MVDVTRKEIQDHLDEVGVYLCMFGNKDNVLISNNPEVFYFNGDANTVRQYKLQYAKYEIDDDSWRVTNTVFVGPEHSAEVINIFIECALWEIPFRNAVHPYASTLRDLYFQQATHASSRLKNTTSHRAPQ